MRLSHVVMMLALLVVAACASVGPSGPVMISASDKAAVQAALPTTKPAVTVTGVVANVTSTEDVITINFKDTTDSQFYAVVLSAGRQSVMAAFNGDIAKAITGKTVHVTGVVALYRGRPQIVISKADQLTVEP
jgi:DNA/RNA endonuclease YhcR with UshA esterase domain